MLKISLEVLTLLNMDSNDLRGLFPLLAITFFLCKVDQVSRETFLLYTLTILILSFRFQLLDLLWQGMHAPNMFLHRYSWIFFFDDYSNGREVLNRMEDPLGFV